MKLKIKMESFGALIKRLRAAQGLLLREVAASIQVDPSFLSRVESDSKRPTRNHVIQLASVLKADENEVLIAYLSEKIYYELRGEALAIEAMLATEKKIIYRTGRSINQTTTLTHENGQK